VIQVAYASSFKKAFKKRIKGKISLEKKFFQKVEVFLDNPHHPSLKTHKLTGELKDLWSFSVDYDLKIVFYFSEPQKAIFIDIGSNDEVY
jgi:mRNA-degrading endonuclease YafQ of YafQ-DinJ toxin-antitoxin module